MYLKVQYNNSIKDYTLTNEYNKPYIKVSNSILPLTTNTTNGIHIKISLNNTTYRPLEYNSMSTSNTYYTSGINSNGLSSTTALTRESTSGESYLTRVSTSATYTVSKFPYGINISMIADSYSTHYESIVTAKTSSRKGGSYNSYTSSYSTYYNYNETSYSAGYVTASCSALYYASFVPKISIESNPIKIIITMPGGIMYLNLVKSTSKISSYSYLSGSSRVVTRYYTRGTTYNNATFESKSTSSLTSNSSRTSASTSIVSTVFDISTQIATYNGLTGSFGILRGNNFTYTIQSVQKTYTFTSGYTRSSTYSTIYYTCSSTSGYSGVSSSSSQSSGWL